jgi:hypothetical protein
MRPQFIELGGVLDSPLPSLAEKEALHKRASSVRVSILYYLYNPRLLPLLKLQREPKKRKTS